MHAAVDVLELYRLKQCHKPIGADVLELGRAQPLVVGSGRHHITGVMSRNTTSILLVLVDCNCLGQHQQSERVRDVDAVASQQKMSGKRCRNLLHISHGMHQRAHLTPRCDVRSSWEKAAVAIQTPLERLNQQRAVVHLLLVFEGNLKRVLSGFRASQQPHIVVPRQPEEDCG